MKLRQLAMIKKTTSGARENFLSPFKVYVSLETVHNYCITSGPAEFIDEDGLFVISEQQPTESVMAHVPVRFRVGEDDKVLGKFASFEEAVAACETEEDLP